MKVCEKCGAQLDDSALFCTMCGTKYEALPEVNNVQVNSAPQSAHIDYGATYQPFVPSVQSDNRKTYSIMAYIPFLWLFGLLSAPEKLDARVRFNVGQGIIANIVEGACVFIAIILTVINNLLFRTRISYYGFETGQYETSALGVTLNSIIWLVAAGIIVFYAVYGIVKVSKNRDSYLPIIGKLAFYK